MSSTRFLGLGSSVALAALLCGCLGAGPIANGTPSPTPAGSLQIKLLGAGGPYSAGPPELVAGRSEPELDALLQSVASSFHQPDPWDGSASVGDHVYIGLATRFCDVINSVSAQLTSPALVTVQVSASGQCAPGAGTAARPPMYLAAIPTAELPQAVVTLRLSDGAGQARVDLRPGHASITPSDIAVLAHDAVRAAFLHVGTDGSSRAIAEIDVLQFPTSPPLCNIVDTPTGQPTGAFVTVNEGSVFPAHEEAFVWLDGALTDCGSAP
jgi:hypothetical protein